MQVLQTTINTKSELFQKNREAMLSKVTQLNEILALSRQGGGEKYVKRHLDKGKLLPRERIELLLDRDAYFLELMPIAGHQVDSSSTGGGVIGGVGVVEGVECLIIASEATSKGGSINEIGLKKSLRLGEIGYQNRLPGISLIESAGADLPNQSKIFVPGGQTFREITRRSKEGIPSICVVFGNSTAGGAYLPGMSDYVVMVENQAKVFLAGPPLVKMATGEVTDDESLGGASMHSKISGVSDYLARDEKDGIRLAREIVSHLNRKKPDSLVCRTPEPPKYNPEELLGIVPANERTPFDQREVLARILDGSRFSEFKRKYGTTLICGWGYLHGFPIGILANNGVIFSDSSQKGAQFIQLCNQSGLPIVFLQNITGFMVGREYEEGGIIKHGAKLINAVSNSEVPLITIMTGASFGAGNYGMAGRAYDPKLLFTWPNHRIAVMGAEQLAGVLDIIRRDAAKKRGQEVDEEQLEMAKAFIRHQITEESTAVFASAHVWDDGIIDPRETRTTLAIALSIANNCPIEGTTSWGVFRH